MNKLLKSLPEKDKKKLMKKKQPKWIDPMLAKLTHEQFSDKNWIYERKLDGERCLVFKNGNDIKLMSRNKKELNKNYPELVKAIRKQSVHNIIGDGEIVVFKNGRTSFERLQQRMHLSNLKEIKKSNVKVYFYIFDLVYLGKYDLTNLKLKTRKSLLKDSIKFKDPLRFVVHKNEKGKKFYEEACKKKWEGLIAKEINSSYKHKRSQKWLKFKCSNQQEFLIIGYTDPEGERIGFGALLVGYYKKDELKYAGKVGTGYSDELLKKLSMKLSKLERKSSPLTEEVKEKNVHWVTPKLVGQIGFTEWTKDGKLRHPRFLGLRNDKKAKNIVRES